MPISVNCHLQFLLTPHSSHTHKTKEEKQCPHKLPSSYQTAELVRPQNNKENVKSLGLHFTKPSVGLGTSEGSNSIPHLAQGEEL